MAQTNNGNENMKTEYPNRHTREGREEKKCDRCKLVCWFSIMRTFSLELIANFGLFSVKRAL